MKKPSERTEIGAWLVEQRRRLGAERGKPFRQQDVVEGLAEMGWPIDASYYRGIEGGSKKPGRELVERLAEFFGTRPPAETTGQSSAELGELVTAIRDQTSAINGLVAELRAMRLSGSQDEEELRAEVDTLLRANRPDDEPHPPPSDTPT